MRRLPDIRDTVVCTLCAQYRRSPDPGASADRPGRALLGAEPLSRTGPAGRARGQGTEPARPRPPARIRLSQGTGRVASPAPALDTCTLAEPERGSTAPRRRPGIAMRADRGAVAEQLPGAALSASLVGSPRFGRSDGTRTRPQSPRSGQCCATTGAGGRCAGRLGRRRVDDRRHGIGLRPRPHCRRNTPGWRIRDVCRVNPGNLREQWRTFDPRTSVAFTHPIREFGGGPRTPSAGRLDPTWPAPFHPAACEECAARSGRYA